MIPGKNGCVVLTFRGGGVGVIAGSRREKNWRSRRGIEEVNPLEKSDHACVHQGVATPLLSPRCLEEALGAFAARHFVNILGCELDWIGVLLQTSA